MASDDGMARHLALAARVPAGRAPSDWARRRNTGTGVLDWRLALQVGALPEIVDFSGDSYYRRPQCKGNCQQTTAAWPHPRRWHPGCTSPQRGPEQAWRSGAQFDGEWAYGRLRTPREG